MKISANSKHTLIISLVSLIYPCFILISQWNTFSITYTRAEYEYKYSQSQYVLGEGRNIVMGDGDIYTYSGIRYIEGEDVTQINFEHPPLVKYLFGLSYKLTGMPNWIIIPLLIIFILCFWQLTAVLPYTWSRYLALGLLLAHPVLYKNIPQTMLDFPMTVFLILTTWQYLKTFKKPTIHNSIFLGVCAGLLLLSKYPVPLLLIYVGLLLLTLLIKGLSFRKLALSFGTLTVTYLLGYTSNFLHGNSLLDFIRFEWWRWQWFSGKLDSPKGMIWQTLFLGRYPRWWDYSGKYVVVESWNLFWPISFLLYFGSWLRSIKLQLTPLFPYQVWIAISLGAYSLGVAEDRFLVPLIPGFAIFGAEFITAFSHRFFPSRSKTIQQSD